MEILGTGKNEIFSLKLYPQIINDWPGIYGSTSCLPFKSKTITGIKPINDINNPVMIITLESVESKKK